MNLTCTSHLGGTVTASATRSGTVYASHTTRAPHTTCWMELAVFAAFPQVPSLAGSLVQSRNDLLSSTAGAGHPVQRSLMLEFELFDDESPMTCANFRRLCCGQSTSRRGQTYCFAGITPSYRGTCLHKIIPDLCVQGGDLTMRVAGGANHLTSAGAGWFPDENKKRRHNEVGLLSMANNGANSNGAQFFITTSATQERALNGRHVCFGRVRRGLQELLTEVAPFGDVQGRPTRYVVVVDCGEGEAPSLDADDCEDDNALYETDTKPTEDAGDAEGRQMQSDDTTRSPANRITLPNTEDEADAVAGGPSSPEAACSHANDKGAAPGASAAPALSRSPPPPPPSLPSKATATAADVLVIEADDAVDERVEPHPIPEEEEGSRRRSGGTHSTGESGSGGRDGRGTPPPNGAVTGAAAAAAAAVGQTRGQQHSPRLYTAVQAANPLGADHQSGAAVGAAWPVQVSTAVGVGVDGDSTQPRLKSALKKSIGGGVSQADGSPAPSLRKHVSYKLDM